MIAGKRTLRLVSLAVAAATVLLLAVPTGLFGASSFDNTGRKLGIGAQAGLGVATSNVGAGFLVGADFKVKAWQGMYLDPTATFFIKSGSWALSIMPAPQYIFRFKKVMVHPYVGMGPAFHIAHVGGGGNDIDDWGDLFGSVAGVTNPALISAVAADDFDGDGGGDTSVKFGIHWTFGAELAVTPNVSIYNDYKFHLIFDSPDVFAITAGCLFWFGK
jgi:hypothetical protein